MSSLNEFRIEQPSLVQALDKYREMEKVLEEEYDSLQDVIIQSSNEWQGAASEALISEMEYFLNEGDYNTAYENVKTMRMCMEDTLEQVNALLVRSEEFPKQLQSSTYLEPMRPAMGDNTVRNGGVLYLDYGKAAVIPDLCEQVYEAAEYLGNVLKQYMEDCEGIMDGIPTYISRVDEAVRKIKRIENYKLSFQKYVQGVMALENDVAVRLAGMKGEPGVDENSSTIVKTREFEMDYNRVTERGKEILRGELETTDYSSIEAQMIIYMIEKENPSFLRTLYALDSYGVSSSKDAVVDQIISYYELNKDPEANLLDVVLENYQNDENIDDYDVYVGYLDYLKDEYYICPAEYEEMYQGMVERLDEDMVVSNEDIEFLKEFMAERNELITELSTGVRYDSTGAKLSNWKKIEVVTALQVEHEMLEEGYDKEFIAGFIGNMKTEMGKFGGLEGLFNTKDAYGLHVIDCVDYLEKYSPYDIRVVNLFELYFDRQICPEEQNQENIDSNNTDLHKWGIGMFQWTEQSRTDALFESYFEIFGITVDNNNHQLISGDLIITEDNVMEMEPIYMTFEQAAYAEVEHMMTESQFHTTLKEYNNMVKTGNKEIDIRAVADIVRWYYVEYRGDQSIEQRQENSVWWYDVRYQNGES